jgi:hypothetical protein
MKKTLFIILLAITPLLTFSQTENQKTIAKFTITDAKNNGVDITPTLLKAGAYTVFYTSGNDGLIYMSNVWPNSNSQSFGPMYGVKSEKLEETYENYEADFFDYNWRYTNDYDNKTGTAKVQVIKIYKPQGVAFTVKIIPEDLDVIVYKGYMDGTIDFSIYD